jgi:mannitol/fructose-specific phosphotransferase system IIA component (Ntr-type)
MDLGSRDFLDLSEFLRSLGSTGIHELIRSGPDSAESGGIGSGVGRSNRDRCTGDVAGVGIDELIDERLIFPDLPELSKDKIFQLMIARASEIHPIIDPEKVFGKLMAWESESMTGIGGISISSIFVDGLEENVMVTGRIPGGIDFNAVDGQPVHFVCLIFCTHDFQRFQTRFLAYLAHRFQSSGFIERILGADTLEDFISALKIEGFYVEEDK